MENQLDMNITYLKGVGPKRAELYKKLGITSIGGLLHTYPRDYIDYTQTIPIAQVVIGENAMIKGYVKRKMPPQIIRRGLTIYKLIVADDTADVVVTIFNSKYAFDNLILGEEYILHGKVMGNLYRKEMSSPQFIHSSERRKILPVYPLTERDYLRQLGKNILKLPYLHIVNMFRKLYPNPFVKNIRYRH